MTNSIYHLLQLFGLISFAKMRLRTRKQQKLVFLLYHIFLYPIKALSICIYYLLLLTLSFFLIRMNVRFVFGKELRVREGVKTSSSPPVLSPKKNKLQWHLY